MKVAVLILLQYVFLDVLMEAIEIFQFFLLCVRGLGTNYKVSFNMLSVDE